MNDPSTTYTLWTIMDGNGDILLDHRGDDAEMTWDEFQEYEGEDGSSLYAQGYRLVRVRAEIVNDDEWPGQRTVQATRAMDRIRKCTKCGGEILGAAFACPKPECPMRPAEAP